MSRTIQFTAALALFTLAFLVSCEEKQEAPPEPVTYSLIEVAQNTDQWTGVAVSPDNRIFVNFPLWSPDIPMSVGELQDDGTVEQYPDAKWNGYHPGAIPVNHFICVQSVVCDHDGYLWVLDPANPFFRGVVTKGPKLVKIDLDSAKVIEYYDFPSDVIERASYLNDVRIDTKNNKAYITDSGIGGILIVDLVTKQVRRVLGNHPSTKAEDVILTIDGQPWIRPGGQKIQVHSDGIALDTANAMLYYQALTGRHLYRIGTRYLLDQSLSEEQLAAHVETVGKTGASDGIIYGPDGRIYLSAIEENAVKAVDADGNIETIVSDSLLAWPDSFAFGPDGSLYVTTSQIHRGSDLETPYRLYKIVQNGVQ